MNTGIRVVVAASALIAAFVLSIVLVGQWWSGMIESKNQSNENSDKDR
jgi:hypothetical protein